MGSGAARGEGAVDRNRRDRSGIIRRSGGGAVAACAGKLERKEGVPTGKPADGCRMVGGGRGGRSGGGGGGGGGGAGAGPGRMGGDRATRCRGEPRLALRLSGAR